MIEQERGRAADSTNPRQVREASPTAVGPGSVVLGRSALAFPRLGIGTGTSGFACQSRQSRQRPEDLSGILLAAHELGVSWWDSSDDYGTHPHLAIALDAVARETVRVSTKTHARTAEQARRSIALALEELRVSYIDLFFLHDMDAPAEIEGRRGALDALQEAKARGLVRAIGLSTHNIDTLEASVGRPEIDVVMTNFNRFEDHMDASLRDYTRALEAHHAAGTGVAVMKAVGEGRLAHVAEESIRWNLERPFIHCVLVGMESLAEVHANARLAATSTRQAAGELQPGADQG